MRLCGLPKHHSDSVAVKGTIGYVAPEYGMGDMVSTQGDVYSFGILLLEMFTSKKPTDDAFKDDLSLHNYVKSYMADNVMEIVDPYILLKHGTSNKRGLYKERFGPRLNNIDGGTAKDELSKVYVTLPSSSPTVIVVVPPFHQPFFLCFETFFPIILVVFVV
ncbi:hypothetical protein F0562_028164 [Nyssa sinensis]|uniref:Protein kinase domain-containing protein n=1 Tax=Nyssa sinensis TaxID=561372 RepID=A0A5J5B9L7_9ASTE|nr:hypothetical protein F0562_028164 [Nyssa sinensis]